MGERGRYKPRLAREVRQCPICQRFFPSLDIMDHAHACANRAYGRLNVPTQTKPKGPKRKRVVRPDPLPTEDESADDPHAFLGEHARAPGLSPSGDADPVALTPGDQGPEHGAIPSMYADAEWDVDHVEDMKIMSTGVMLADEKLLRHLGRLPPAETSPSDEPPMAPQEAAPAAAAPASSVQDAQAAPIQEDEQDADAGQGRIIIFGDDFPAADAADEPTMAEGVDDDAADPSAKARAEDEEEEGDPVLRRRRLDLARSRDVRQKAAKLAPDLSPEYVWADVRLHSRQPDDIKRLTRAEEFLINVKERFANRRHVLRKFHDVLHSLVDERSDTVQLMEQAAVILEHEPDLLEQFNRLLPKNYNIKAISLSRLPYVVCDHETGARELAQSFISRVHARLKAAPRLLLDLLRAIDGFPSEYPDVKSVYDLEARPSNNGVMPIGGLSQAKAEDVRNAAAEIERVLNNCPWSVEDFITEFMEFLPNGFHQELPDWTIGYTCFVTDSKRYNGRKFA